MCFGVVCFCFFAAQCMDGYCEIYWLSRLHTCSQILLYLQWVIQYLNSVLVNYCKVLDLSE